MRFTSLLFSTFLTISPALAFHRRSNIVQQQQQAFFFDADSLIGKVQDLLTTTVDEVVERMKAPHPVELPIFHTNTTGRILLSSTTHPSLRGYLGPAPSDLPLDAGYYGFLPSSSVSRAVRVTLPGINCPSLASAFDLYAPLTNTRSFDGVPFLGVGGFKSGNKDVAELSLSGKSINGGGLGFLVSSNHTAARTHAAGLSPIASPSIFGSSSRVWSLDCDSLQLSATWTGAFGSKVPLKFLTGARGGPVVVTAAKTIKVEGGEEDVGAFERSYGEGREEVTLTFIPDQDQWSFKASR